MNIENTNKGKIIDNAFAIYKEKFIKQVSITAIINSIYMALVSFTIWYGFFIIIPNAPKKVTGILEGNSTQIMICLIILALTFIFKFIVTSANIIVAHYDENLRKLLFRTVKVMPKAFIVYLPFVVIFACISYATHFNKDVVIFSLAIVSIIFLLINILLTLSSPISQIDNTFFIKSIIKSFAILKKNKSFIRFFAINILWFLIYWGLFILITIAVGFVFPTPSFFAKIPYSQFLVPVYRICITYLITMVITPIGKNILYSFYNTPHMNKENASGFGSRLFAVAVDFYLLLALLSSVFYVIFIFLSRNGSNSIFTMNLPLLVWLVVFAMFIFMMVLYRLCFKYIFKRLTAGEKIMGINR